MRGDSEPLGDRFNMPIPLVDFSHERLTHFKCVNVRCQQYWSIADFDTPGMPWDQSVIYCPKCRQEHRLKLEESHLSVFEA